MKYGLCAARAYPFGDRKLLHVAADQYAVLWNYDDLFDDSISDLTHDESGAAEPSRIMLSVLSDTDNFQPTPNLLVATTSHQYALQFLSLSRLLQHKRASLMQTTSAICGPVFEPHQRPSCKSDSLTPLSGIPTAVAKHSRIRKYRSYLSWKSVQLFVVRQGQQRYSR